MVKEAMIVSAQPEASEAGARVLMAGGNAVDAAITALGPRSSRSTNVRDSRFWELSDIHAF